MDCCRPSAVIVAQSDLTIAELVGRYKKHAEAYYVSGGTLHNIGTACRALRLRYGGTQAASFGPLSLKAVRQQFVDEGSSRRYCNRLTDLIRRLFKWAASEQLIPTSTWQSLTTVTGLRRGHTEAPENEPIGPVDDAVVESTLPHLSNIVAAMVRLERLTGMRPDEVCPAAPVRSGPERRRLELPTGPSQDRSSWPAAGNLHRPQRSGRFAALSAP